MDKLKLFNLETLQNTPISTLRQILFKAPLYNPESYRAYQKLHLPKAVKYSITGSRFNKNSEIYGIYNLRIDKQKLFYKRIRSYDDILDTITNKVSYIFIGDNWDYFKSKIFKDKYFDILKKEPGEIIDVYLCVDNTRYFYTKFAKLYSSFRKGATSKGIPKYNLSSCIELEGYLLYLLKLCDVCIKPKIDITKLKLTKKTQIYLSYIPLEELTLLITGDKPYLKYDIRLTANYYTAYTLYDNILRTDKYNIMVCIKALLLIYKKYIKETKDLTLDFIKENKEEVLMPFITKFILLLRLYVRKDLHLGKSSQEYWKEFFENEHNLNDLYYHSRNILDKDFTKKHKIFLDFLCKKIYHLYYHLWKTKKPVKKIGLHETYIGKQHLLYIETLLERSFYYTIYKQFGNPFIKNRYLSLQDNLKQRDFMGYVEDSIRETRRENAMILLKKEMEAKILYEKVINIYKEYKILLDERDKLLEQIDLDNQNELELYSDLEIALCKEKRLWPKAYNILKEEYMQRFEKAQLYAQEKGPIYQWQYGWSDYKPTPYMYFRWVYPLSSSEARNWRNIPYCAYDPERNYNTYIPYREDKPTGPVSIIEQKRALDKFKTDHEQNLNVLSRQLHDEREENFRVWLNKVLNENIIRLNFYYNLSYCLITYDQYSISDEPLYDKEYLLKYKEYLFDVYLKSYEDVLPKKIFAYSDYLSFIDQHTLIKRHKVLNRLNSIYHTLYEEYTFYDFILWLHNKDNNKIQITAHNSLELKEIRNLQRIHEEKIRNLQRLREEKKMLRDYNYNSILQQQEQDPQNETLSAIINAITPSKKHYITRF